jgi:prolyl-tRNA synthetase
MPTVLPAALWRKTKRWDDAGPELLRVRDRKLADYCLAPTHEEPVTALVQQKLSSHKDLPLRLYQVGAKFRDEARPRSGLLRARQFLMKDLYTFDVSKAAALRTYDAVRGAYRSIFARVGLPGVCEARADSGKIGGDYSHEFHVVADSGEDTLLHCACCGYVANEEKAVSKTTTTAAATMAVDDNDAEVAPFSRFDPRFEADGADLRDIDADFAALVLRGTEAPLASVELNFLSRTPLTRAEKAAVAASARHDDDCVVSVVVLPRGAKLNTVVAAAHGTLISGARAREWLAEYDGDQSERLGSRIFYDESLAALQEGKKKQWRLSKAGDACEQRDCPNQAATAAAGGDAVCGAPLQSSKGIEIGHVFYLGTKYSAPLKARFRDAAGAGGKMQLAQMGCFGIGVSRFVAAAIEASHDSKGIVWPEAIAPYKLCIIAVGGAGSENERAAHSIYDTVTANAQLCDDVVLDDRDSSPGFKMKDADLIGFAWILVVGRSFARDGTVELQRRGRAVCEGSLTAAVADVDDDAGGSDALTLKEQLRRMQPGESRSVALSDLSGDLFDF